MVRRNQIEQLDQAVEAVLTSPAQLAPPQGEMELLVRLASELRDLPSPDFKARLKAELEEKTMSITTTTASRSPASERVPCEKPRRSGPQRRRDHERVPQ